MCVKPPESPWHCFLLGEIALPRQFHGTVSVLPVWICLTCSALKDWKTQGRAGEQCQAYAIYLCRVNQWFSLWYLKPRVRIRKEQQNFYESEPSEPNLKHEKKKKKLTWRGGTGKSWRQGLYRVIKHKELWLVQLCVLSLMSDKILIFSNLTRE